MTRSNNEPPALRRLRRGGFIASPLQRGFRRPQGFAYRLTRKEEKPTSMTTTAWKSGTSYKVGDIVVYNGITYEALQAETSISTWIPSTSPTLWQAISSSTGSGTAPAAPTGLVATAVGSGVLTLSWTAVTPPAGARLGFYTVLQNGVPVATTASTSIAITGLSATTPYSFTVEAADQYGLSAPSSALAVTTAAGTSTSPAVAAWSAAAIYTAGMQASENGVIYQANWWTQGNDPRSNNGGAGTGQPWAAVGAAGPATQVPTTPASLAASGTSSVATVLTWQASTVPGGGTVTDYVIYENGKQIATTTATSYAVAGLTPSTAYSFAVAAEDAAGDSPLSATINVTTAALGLPTTPTQFLASNTTSSGTTLAWQASTVPGGGGVIDYVIYENGQSIGTTTATSYAVAGLAASTTYSFTIAAEDDAGASPQTGAIRVTTTPGGSTSGLTAAAWSATAIYTAGMTASEKGLIYQANWWTQGNDPQTDNGAVGTGKPWTLIGTAAPPPPVPTTPAGLAASSTTAGGTTLAWQASTVPGGSASVTDYAIYENGTLLATTTTTSYTVHGLAASTSYRFTVAAEDAGGASPLSTAVSVTTGALPASTGGNGHSLPLSGNVFAPYIDMGLSQDDDLVAIAQASGIKVFTLAFVQSSGNGTIGWSGVGTLADDMLANGQTIQQQVQSLRAIGGDVILSFGGAAGIDPAAAATSATALQAEYQSAIDRYGLTSLDFDIEGAEVADTHAMALRDQALVALKAANPGLAISFTLPVLPTGLDANGMNVLATAKKDGLAPDMVNIMTMDYGSSVDNGGAMGSDAISAAQATLQQIASLGLSSKLGITPMIGVNDVASEIFSLADAQQVESWAASNVNVSRLSMWSVARDNGAGAGHAYASADTSGIAQSNRQFASILGKF